MKRLEIIRIGTCVSSADDVGCEWIFLVKGDGCAIIQGENGPRKVRCVTYEPLVYSCRNLD